MKKKVKRKEKTYTASEAADFCWRNPGVELQCVEYERLMLRRPDKDSFFLEFKDDSWDWSVLQTHIGGDSEETFKLYFPPTYTGLEALILSAQAAKEGKQRIFKVEEDTDCWVCVDKTGNPAMSTDQGRNWEPSSFAFDNGDGPYMEVING